MNKQTIWIIKKIFFIVKLIVGLSFVIGLLYILYDSYFYKHTITIAVGTKTGAYATYGKAYKKELEKYPNVRVKIKITEGSIKAQEAVLKGEADFAFAQEGTENFKLTALANVAYEPIWIFVKKDANITSFSDLNGKIVNIGSKNTGTYPVSLDFLKLIDFNISMTKTLPSEEGFKQLKEGKIDAMVYTVGINSKLLNNILNDPTIIFLDFKEAEAYRKNLLEKQFLYPKIESKYYHPIHINANSLSLKNKIPSKDITLLAKRTLLLTKDAPDEAIRAILKVADLLHSKVGILHKENEFPNTSMLRIRENKVAKRYFEQPINAYESNRYIIVDLKPQNILIDIDGQIALIDIDSIQVTTPSRTYHADAWTEEYCPPEFFISQINPKQKRIDASWDYFAFAVIIYQLFFQIHPFMGTVGTNTLLDNIKNKYFVHGKNKKVFQFSPPLHNNFNKLSLALQNYFEETFDGQAYQRVSFDFWKQEFFSMQSKQIKVKPINTPKSSSKNTTNIQSTISNFRTKFLNSIATAFKVFKFVVILAVVGFVILFVSKKFIQEDKESIIDYGNLHTPAISTTPIIRTNRDSSINLRGTYSYTNKILTFSDIIKDGNKINFSYKLTTIKPPSIKRSKGYIDINNLKIYLDGISGEIHKNNNSIISIKIDGNLFL